MRIISRCCVSIWHKRELVSSRSQLSILTMRSAAISAASRRFSNSSSLFPCAITGASCPVAKSEAISTSNDLPVRGAGAVNACSGAVIMARRSSAVRIPDSATERSTGRTNGNARITVFRDFSAVSASAFVGGRRDGRKAPSVRLEQELAGDVVARLLAERAIDGEKRCVGDAGQDRQLPMPGALEVGLSELLRAILGHDPTYTSVPLLELGHAHHGLDHEQLFDRDQGPPERLATVGGFEFGEDGADDQGAALIEAMATGREQRRLGLVDVLHQLARFEPDQVTRSGRLRCWLRRRS